VRAANRIARLMLVENKADLLSREAFNDFLQRLAPDRDAAAKEYEVLRRKLTAFFELRGFLLADSMADEVLDRMARRLASGERIENVRAYGYGVARLVALEYQRQEVKRQTAAEWVERGPHDNEQVRQAAERRLVCLERCLQDLRPDERELIVGYCDRGETPTGKRRLARELGVSDVALRSRAHRIRRRLETCLAACVKDPVGS
jgi:DNA-directed RNA polymerase specialized sigma24 family protein